jgi:hypothetical protein
MPTAIELPVAACDNLADVLVGLALTLVVQVAPGYGTTFGLN